MRRVLKYLFYLVLLSVLLIGTLWPQNLDFLLPERLHYAHWPLWLRVAGWGAVALVIIADYWLIADSSKKPA